MTFDILYSDNHLFVVNKPSGISTQPNDKESGSLEELCKEWIKQHKQKPGNVFLHALHRIDKPVSGVVVFARTSKALSRLNLAMRNGETQKIYLALLDKKPALPEGTLEHYLAHGNFRAEIVSKSHPAGKKARLHYQVVKFNRQGALVKITLETGRYHQIRIQMASNGTPIIGDVKYGSQKPYAEKSIALHHAQFQIPHPTTKELMTFTCPPPFETCELFSL